MRVRSRLGRALAAETAAVGLAAGYNVLFHRVVPRRWHLPANLAAAVALVATARVAGEGWGELGLQPVQLQRAVLVQQQRALQLAQHLFALRRAFG